MVNIWTVITGAILSMIIGAIWYGPLFGKKWMEILGISALDADVRKKMQKSAGPLYAVQFILTLFQILVLGHLVGEGKFLGGLSGSLWIWAGFIIPTLAGAVMWTGGSAGLKWARFMIQAGYQLVMFVIYGLLFQFWK